MKNNLKLFVSAALSFLVTLGCGNAYRAESAVYGDARDFSGGGGLAASRTAAEAERSLFPVSGPAPEEQPAAPPDGGKGDSARRKLVKRASLHVRVDDPAAADTSLEAMMKTYGAYAASTEINEDLRTWLIRVPEENYGRFLAEADGMGRVLRRSENAEDVTLRYYDLEGRLATKRELLKTFRNYLGRAKNIEEILSVEERIADLQNEIDGTGEELRRLANLVDYATIELVIYGPVISASRSGPAPGERILGLLGFFGEFISILAAALAGIVLYGVPCVLILVLLFWLLFGRIGLVKKLWRLAAGGKKKK